MVMLSKTMTGRTAETPVTPRVCTTPTLHRAGTADNGCTYVTAFAHDAAADAVLYNVRDRATGAYNAGCRDRGRIPTSFTLTVHAVHGAVLAELAGTTRHQPPTGLGYGTRAHATATDIRVGVFDALTRSRTPRARFWTPGVSAWTFGDTHYGARAWGIPSTKHTTPTVTMDRLNRGTCAARLAPRAYRSTTNPPDRLDATHVMRVARHTSGVKSLR
jgi:hypothetical protein